MFSAATYRARRQGAVAWKGLRTATGNSIAGDVVAYLALMTCAIAIVGLSGSTSTLLWALNLVAFAVTIGKDCFKATKSAWFLAASFLATGLLSTLFSAEYLTANLKTLGMHANLLVVPLYVLFISNVVHVEEGQDAADRVLSMLSVAGTIAVLFAWVYGASDYLAVLSGSLGAYQADVDGFFNNKNVYGVFVSLSCVADLCLRKSGSDPGRWRLTLIAMKVFAVVVSFSRAALLQCVMALLLFLWFEKRHSFRDWAIVLAVLLAVVVAYGFVPEFKGLVDGQILRLDVGDAGRGVARERALDVYCEDGITMLFGIGFAGVSERSLDLDNAYFYELLSGGIVRMAFCIIFIVWSLSRIWKMPRERSSYRSASLAVALSYLAYMGFESIAPLELGIINFTFILYMFIIPGYLTSTELKVGGEMKPSAPRNFKSAI